MSKTDFAAEIENAKREIEAYVPGMVEAQGRWIGAVGEWAASSWSEAAEKAAVVSDPETTIEKKGGLAAMRNELRELVDGAYEIAFQMLSHDLPHTWPHLYEGDRLHEYLVECDGRSPFLRRSGRRNAPDVIDRHLRLLLGRVATLVADHDYVPSDSYKLTRIHTPDGGRGEEFKYGYAMSWSEEMESWFGRYGELDQSRLDAVARLENLREQQTQAEAKALWDEAA